MSLGVVGGRLVHLHRAPEQRDRVGFAAANAFFDVTGETGGYSYFEMYDNGNNETRLFYAIPEPATLGVLCLGGSMMMRRRRRK